MNGERKWPFPFAPWCVFTQLERTCESGETHERWRCVMKHVTRDLSRYSHVNGVSGIRGLRNYRIRHFLRMLFPAAFRLFRNRMWYFKIYLDFTINFLLWSKNIALVKSNSGKMETDGKCVEYLKSRILRLRQRVNPVTNHTKKNYKTKRTYDYWCNQRFCTTPDRCVHVPRFSFFLVFLST